MNKKLSQEELDSIALARESILQQAREKTAKSKKRIAEAKKELEAKEKNEEPPNSPTEEPEIVAVISMEDYEKAGGDIPKILNNTPENLFDEEVFTQSEAEITVSEPEPEIIEAPKPRLRKFGRIISAGEDEVEKRKTILKEIGAATPDEYATSVLEEAAPISFAKLLDMQTGEYVEINKTVFTVGISNECDLVISQPEKKHTVSRTHASIIIKNDTIYIRDSSSNGTFVGNTEESFFRLPKGNAVELKNGQLIKFADVIYKFEKGES